MEDRIINIEKEYNLLKDKYPNLINLNKRILEFHKEKMKFIIKECEISGYQSPPARQLHCL